MSIHKEKNAQIHSVDIKTLYKVTTFSERTSDSKLDKFCPWGCLLEAIPCHLAHLWHFWMHILKGYSHFIVKKRCRNNYFMLVEWTELGFLIASVPTFSQAFSSEPAMSQLCFLVYLWANFISSYTNFTSFFLISSSLPLTNMFILISKCEVYAWANLELWINFWDGQYACATFLAILS